MTTQYVQTTVHHKLEEKNAYYHKTNNTQKTSGKMHTLWDISSETVITLTVHGLPTSAMVK